MTTYFPAQIEQGLTGGNATIVIEPTQDDIIMNGQGAATGNATVTMDAGGADDMWATFGAFSANGDVGTGWTPQTYDATTWTEN